MVFQFAGGSQSLTEAITRKLQGGLDKSAGLNCLIIETLERMDTESK